MMQDRRLSNMLAHVEKGPFANQQLLTIIEQGELDYHNRSIFGRTFTTAIESGVATIEDLSWFFGVSPNTIHGWTTGVYIPPAYTREATFYRLEKYLRCNLNLPITNKASSSC